MFCIWYTYLNVYVINIYECVVYTYMFIYVRYIKIKHMMYIYIYIYVNVLRINITCCTYINILCIY